MTKEIVISLKNISKIFKIPHDKQYGLKGTFLNLIKGKNSYEEFYALKEINIDVKKGEFIGIIGPNGSGKSTLLKIIANILKPDTGSVKVNGNIASFLELGLGFHEELTGKENVYLYGAILGLNKKQIDQKYSKIVSFSELERFMDMKLKNYSSGMHGRLAFSIAIQVEADILLVDEVLAVGDIEFQKKCLNVFEEYKKDSKTVILVSHNVSLIEKISDRILYLPTGTIKDNAATKK